MKIIVLAGGLSPERDVSLTSGSLIANALIDEGQQVCLADVYLGIKKPVFGREKYTVPGVRTCEPDLAKLRAESGNGDALIGEGIIDACRKADVVFLALHGAMGENGQLQATLDNFGIRYTGSGYVGSLLAMDKDVSKQIFRFGGVNTPDWVYITPTPENVKMAVGAIGFPAVVKPCACGSSVGVSMANDENELKKALELASLYEGKVLIEKKISGREFTVGILDGEVLPVIEIIPTEGFYDYKNKYQAGKTEEICPANIPEELRESLAEQTRRAFNLLRLSGYARFDFIVDENITPWCLEANTLPGMTPTSLLPQMAAEIGIPYGKLCLKIADTALKKQ